MPILFFGVDGQVTLHAVMAEATKLRAGDLRGVARPDADFGDAVLDELGCRVVIDRAALLDEYGTILGLVILHRDGGVQALGRGQGDGFGQFLANLIGSLVGNEVKGNEHARNGVLLHAHDRQEEAVNHILRGDLDDRRTIDGQVELVQRDDVVLGAGIVLAVEADGVRLFINQLDVRAAEDAVGPGIVDVPRELLGDDTDMHGVRVGWERADLPRPERNGDAHQQQDLNDCHRRFQVRRGVCRYAGVISFRRVALAEAKDRVEKKGNPPHEQHDHEDVHIKNQPIGLRSVL